MYSPLGLFIVQVTLWLKDAAPSALLADVTGLSKSRFRNSNRYDLRQSSIDEINQKIEYDICERLKTSFNNSEIESIINNLPSKVNGFPCPFSDFIYFYFITDINAFVLTQSIALEIDALDNIFLRYFPNDSLDNYKSVLLSSPLLSESYIANSWSQTGMILKNSLNSANDINALFGAFEPVKSNILLSFLATLDLEFCSAAYGKTLKLRPLFLDLLPKITVPINEDDATVKLPKWNKVRLPIRRLLELIHAIYHFSKNKKWPSKPIGRKALGLATGFSDYEIGKLYNGSRALNLIIFTNICKKLDDNVGAKVGSSPPVALLIAALCWQNILVDKERSKINSLIVFDQAGYLKLWSLHKAERASQLKSGSIDWPSWLNG